MSLTKKDKEEIEAIAEAAVEKALGLLNQKGVEVQQKKDSPNYENWSKNGIKAKLAGVLVAPEDYFEGDKRFFTWDEAVATQENMPDGWRLPTRQEMVLLCEEFARTDPNKDYDPSALMEGLNLEKNGFIYSSDMEDYNENPESFDEIQSQGTYGLFWSIGANSSTSARHLNFGGSNVSPEDYYYKSYGFSVRCVRNIEFPEKGENQ